MSRRARFWIGVLALMVPVCGGCAPISTTARFGSIKAVPPRVIAWQCPAPHRYRQVGVMAFEVPKGMERAGLEMAQAYSEVLYATGMFGGVCLLADGGLEGAVTAPDGAHLMVRAKVVQLVVGSGALSEHVDLHVWVTDVRTGRVLWWVEQSASSAPRPDVDLFWNVLPGGGAASYIRLTRVLAHQFAELLSEKEARRRGCLNLGS